MGLFSWLFPKPADRIAKAKRYIEDERYAEARLEVVELDDAEAVEIRRQAEHFLVKINLEKAVQRARAGDDSQVVAHVELAENFHDGSLEALFADAKEQIARLGEADKVDHIFSNLTASANRRSRLGTDPGDFTLAAYTGEGAVRLFFGGERAFNLPGLEYEPRHDWFKPAWLVEAVTDQQDIILRYKSVCAPEYHDAVDAVWEVLASALSHQAAERPELAVLQLVEGSLKNPIIAYELGRSASALGCHDAAQLCFMAAREAAGGDINIGELSASFWSLTTALWAGDLKHIGELLAEVDQNADPRLLATVAIESGQLEEATRALEQLPADDEERPQLEGALKLQVALQAGFEQYPIIKDQSARGTADWNDALEAVTADLQTHLDMVMGDLQSLNESDIEEKLALEEESFTSDADDAQPQEEVEQTPPKPA